MKKTFFLLSVLLFTDHMLAGTIVVQEGTYATTEASEIINSQVHQIAEELNKDSIILLSGNQKNLADATHSAGTGVALSGALYTGFDARIASIGFGVGGGIENPFHLENFANNIRQGDDKGSSFAVGGFTTDITVNADQIPFVKHKGILLNVKFGYADSNDLIKDVQFNSFLFGLGARYKLFELPVQMPLFRIRALTIGSGLYYSSSSLTFTPDPIEENADEENGYYTESTTNASFVLNNSNFVIPLDLVTSAEAFNFFNIIVGTGIDLSLGSSEIYADSDTTIRAYNSQHVLQETDDPAEMKLTDYKTKGSGPILRYKLIYGFGFSLGPARLEFPIIYYPDKGWAASVVFGASL
ncbi:MAG: hypothetical protein PF637_06215 [Spirochaetes bacterium]|nr:hypothetical protein [Spirochaetota bacterium]